MSDDNKTPKIIFAPGCFDSFEGTQEELDELVAEIQRLADSGELFDRSQPVDLDSLTDEQLEILEQTMEFIESDDEVPPKRLLN